MEPEFRSMAEQRRHDVLLHQLRHERKHWEITINLSNATAEDTDYFCDFLEPILLGYDKVHPGHDIDMSSQLSEDQ